MINRVLEREFVLKEAEKMRDELARQAAEEGAGDEGRSANARDALDRAIEAEQAAASGAGEGEAWVPRDAALSIVQTVAEEQIRRRHPERLVDGPEDWIVATQDVRDDDVEGSNDFTTTDLEWVTETAKAFARRLWRWTDEFVETVSPPAATLGERARVVLISDWATGGEAAQAVADIARAEIESARDRDVHVVHLGDIYYTGDEAEVQNWFLEPWPVQPGEEDRYHSWALIGNHEIYSGGHGYYGTLLADPRFAGQHTKDGKPISYFSLSNRYWQILGIDTASDDDLGLFTGRAGFLRDPQDKWIAERVRSAHETGQRTMLLSHHDYLRVEEPGGKAELAAGNLSEKLAPAFEAGGIDAWFWGHDHVCKTFAGRREVRYSACVGHGAIPKAKGEPVAEPGEWEFVEGGSQWRWCGLVVLDFAREHVDVRYVANSVGPHDDDVLPVS